MASDLDPLAVILVTSGTRGNRLLFRYPYSEESSGKQKVKKNVGKNPYTIKISENLQDAKKSKSYSGYVQDCVLSGVSNQTLANVLIVKSELCGKKFSVQIDDARFVGFPTSLLHLTRETSQPNSQSLASRQQQSILTVNVVFLLKARAAESVASCYQELAQQLTVAIAQEEKRCQYLTKEAKIMMTALEEVSGIGEDEVLSPLRHITQTSSLAKELKSVYESLHSCGQVLFHLNQWTEINFCLPHKIHAMHTPGRTIQLESIYRCLSYVRPYHGILLTKSDKELLNFLPLDSSPSLIRLIRLTSPLKNLKILALETDLSLTQIYQLVCHMIYWGFAMLIYPLCQSNIYVLSPSTANTAVDSLLSKDFSDCFPGLHLVQEMSRFSFPSRMCDSSIMITYPSSHLLDRHYQVVLWMLQHRLLNQLHTYVNLVPPKRKDIPGTSNQSTISSSHSSNSYVQVVEESFLSVLLEDITLANLDHAASNSDVASVNSEESGGHSATPYTSQLSKSPSQEANSEGSLMVEEMKAQYRMQGSLLNELEPQMKAAILKCPASKNPEDLHLFAKLCPYFNGKHHLEEVMFYENLRRSQLEILLDKFKDVLIWCQHEDPATSLL